MGILATAAQDPVFFAHHANIDRLWDVWLALNPSANSNPTDPAWLAHEWSFYDQNANWTAIAVSDVVDHVNSLQYVYQPPSAATQARAVHGAHRAAAPAARRLTPEPQTTPVTIAAAPAAEVEHEASEYVLRIDDVTLPPGTGTMVRVFINKPNATVATPDADPHYVGYFSIVPHRSGKSGHGIRRDVVLPLSNANVRAIGGASTEPLERATNITVTLVPFTGRGTSPKASNEMGVTYARVTIARATRR